MNCPNCGGDELHLNKTQLANKIGISSQFLGLVEDGKGNLVYKSIKKNIKPLFIPHFYPF